eukprot:Nk52_evm34s1444 gene=Nk52_evmTU34s1444
MSHCREEAHDHDHDHGGGGHDHDHDDPERGIEFSLYRYIDVEKVVCLNESETDSAKKVFKPWEDRLSVDGFVQSDADEELIIHIPFTGDMKIKSICVHGPTNPKDSHPSHMKAFINRNDIDFSNANEIPPTQEWDLQPDSKCRMQYETRITKFQNVHSLTLYFDTNFGDDSTIISYIGFKGDYKAVTRDTIITVYELNANPADHKTKSDNVMQRHVN